MKAKFDLVVIGSGAAGRTVAFACAEAGWSVAVADEQPFGGTCALRGCDAKKVLAGASEIVARAKGLEGKGIDRAPAIDWPALMAFKATFTEPLPEAMAGAMEEAGIHLFRGHARFSGPNSMRIGEEEVESAKVVIASGARPRLLHIPGEEHLTTSDRFLSLDALPRRIVFVGGGFISFEFAHIAARAGAETTILNRSGRILREFDRDLVEMLAEASREAGIRIVMDAPVHSLRKEGDALVVAAGAEGEREFVADMAVHGAGRVPAIGGLDPGAGRVAVERGHIQVNAFLQNTTNPDVYAAGDAAGTGPQLTPVATADGEVVAHNLINGNSARADYRVVAGVVYTHPPLAKVGLTEEEARSRNLRYVRHFEDTSSWYASRRVGLTRSGYKILATEGGSLLGVHLLGHDAGEVINVFALAMKAKVGIEALRGTHWAYPTGGWDIRNMLV